MSINSVSNPFQSYNQNGLSRMQSDFQQLGQALQSGNMGAAQQDYSNIQQLSQVIKAYNGHHRHHGVETSPVDSASVSNPDSISVLNSSSASSSSSPSSSSSGSSSSSSSSPDNNIVGQSMQSVISQYLSNSIAGGLLGGSGLLSNVLGSINISI